jgi:O-antigen/teichoic acid export membrane protein
MRPTLQLLSGRLVGFVVAFAIPMVLVRVLDTQEIGTYRLLFLIYGTLLSLAQLGMAESLYYFVPQRPAESGRCVGNAVATLAVVGVALGLAVAVAAPALGARFNNPQLAELLPMLGIVLGLMLTATVFEIAMVCRQQYRRAAVTYGASDLLRALLLTLPALVTGRLDALVMGAVVFALVRVVVAAVYLRREFGSSGAASWPTRCRSPRPWPSSSRRSTFTSMPSRSGSTRRRSPSTRSAACRFRWWICWPTHRQT